MKFKPKMNEITLVKKRRLEKVMKLKPKFELVAKSVPDLKRCLKGIIFRKQEIIAAEVIKANQSSIKLRIQFRKPSDFANITIEGDARQMVAVLKFVANTNAYTCYKGWIEVAKLKGDLK